MRLPTALAALTVLGACASPQTTSGSYSDYQRNYQAGLAAGDSATDAAVAAAEGQATESHGAISDEQDFAAVSSRETIASDKERIAENRAQYTQIAPTALPERTETSAPNLISYALNAPNRLGQPYYKRGGLSLSNSQRACDRYQSPEDAQIAFLKAGGPDRDRKNLDPDGDGFACTWDPTPFQKARG